MRLLRMRMVRFVGLSVPCRSGSRIKSGMTAVGNAENAEKRRGRKGKYKFVSPAQAGVQEHRHHSHLPLWIPDQVRDDDVLDKYTLTLRSAASRRVRGVEGQTRNDIGHKSLSVLRAFSAPSAVNLYPRIIPAQAGGALTSDRESGSSQYLV